MSPYTILEWPDSSSQVFQQSGETIDTFYNCILKLARQCEFSEMNERLIDAIIFGTNCIKAQDKLLQTPKTLSLQQCLTVCRHYESQLTYTTNQARQACRIFEKTPSKVKAEQSKNHSITVDLSPREENLTKEMTHKFRLHLNNCITSADVVVKHPIKIGKNNAQLGDIFAKSVTDITTMSQCVVRYQSSPKNMNTYL